MKSFCIRLVVFFTFFFLIDKVFIVFREYSAVNEIDNRLELILKGEINKNILIFGSSRGARNIIAANIEDSLKQSSYNLSYPGSNIQFHEFLLKKLIEHNEKPKLVILTLDDDRELMNDATINFRFDRLYPLVKYPEIRNELIEHGEKNRVLSKLFILHQLNISNFDIRTKQFSSLDTIDKSGSMPISFQRKNRKWEYGSSDTYSVDKEGGGLLSSFLSFQKICVENEIELLYVFPPNFKERSISFYDRIEELSHSEVKLFTYNVADVRYKDSHYFYDEGHLNKKGSTIFTNELISFLKNTIFK